MELAEAGAIPPQCQGEQVTNFGKNGGVSAPATGGGTFYDFGRVDIALTMLFDICSTNKFGFSMSQYFSVFSFANISKRSRNSFRFSIQIIQISKINNHVGWCHGSILACDQPEQYTIQYGEMQVLEPLYLWPTKCPDAFSGWRNWTTYDDCCTLFF